jgi:ABC-2 type transport system permease protein
MSAINAPRVSRNLARIYALEAKTELLKLLRLPMYILPTLLFPLMFYLLFGVAFRRPGSGPFDMATYLVASYGAFGVMNAALFGFGVGVAVERGQGWMLFKRATPMPALSWLVGKLVACFLSGLLMITLLFTVAATVGGVQLPLLQWLSLAGVLAVGTIPFAAFGLAVGSWVGPNSAPAIINLLVLPMSFASGMWFPIQMMPGIIKKIAQFLPAYHYAQLALGQVGLSRGGPVLRSVVVLSVFTLLSFALARLGDRRDEGKTFG